MREKVTARVKVIHTGCEGASQAGAGGSRTLAQGCVRLLYCGCLLVSAAAFVTLMIVMPVVIMMLTPLVPLVMIIIPVPNTAASGQHRCKHCAQGQCHGNFSHNSPPVLVDVRCLCPHTSRRKMNAG